jgi:hypothetical protein
MLQQYVSLPCTTLKLAIELRLTLLFFLKKEPKTLALRGFIELSVFFLKSAKSNGSARFHRVISIVLFKKRTKNISSARLHIVISLLKSKWLIKWHNSSKTTEI